VSLSAAAQIGEPQFAQKPCRRRVPLSAVFT
jgi:hypothetical protein